MATMPPMQAASTAREQRIAEIAALNLDQVHFPKVFQAIVDLACAALDCPVALLSIINESEQLVIARRGLDTASLPLGSSLCANCVDLGGEPLWIDDALGDARIANQQLAAPLPFARSYLGLPIRSPRGIIIGALSAMHARPGAFTIEHVPLLRNFVQLVEHTLLSHAQTEELEIANTIFEQAERSAHIGSWMVNIRANSLYWSKESFRIHGLPQDASITIDDSLAFLVSEDRERIRLAMQTVVGENPSFQTEASIVTAQGLNKRILLRGQRIDHNGKPDRIVGIMQDITEQHFQTLALQHAARFDRLTELGNRASFDEELSRRTGRSFTEPAYIGMIDLDGFKDVNDGHGHLVGDFILEEVARRIKAHAPPGSFVARWGGDEFAILFPALSDREDVLRETRALITRISAPIKLAATELQLGATIGLSAILPDLTAQEIVRRADLALYAGKRNGGCQAIFYTELIESAHSERSSAIGSVNLALAEERVFIGYQPIINMKTGQIKGFEALLRFSTREGGIVSAGEVLPALLDPGTCRRIGNRIHQLIARDAPHLFAASKSDMRIGINVSEAELIEPDFAERFIALQEAAGLGMDKFVFEITETMLIVNDVATVNQTLERLVEAGAKIALDDFGTGFSSLTHLRDFPISWVKIDQSFVAQLHDLHQSRLIVQAIVSMSQNLGIDVVAEGIETVDQARLLASMGCQFGQGFYFGQAVVAAEAAGLLSSPGVEARMINIGPSFQRG